MSQAVTPSGNPDKKPTADQLEAEIAETRDHLAASVDQLAAKLDVKTQAQDKIADTKAQAQEKISDVTAQAQEKVQQASDTAKGTAQDLVTRFKTASRPVQAAIVGGPIALLVLIILGRSRRG